MTTWQLRKAACFLAFSVKVTNPFLRPLLEIQKCTSVEKSQCLCGFPLLSGCTSMPRSCTLSLILVHLYNNKNPSVYAGLRHCCTLSYSKPWGPWPDWTSRLLAFRKGGSLRKSRVETIKSFVHLFKGGGVWGETPRPYRGAGAKPPPSHTPKKGDVCPPLGVAQSPGLALSPCGRVRALPCFFPPAAPVSGRNFLKKVSSKTFTRLRRCTFILCIF